MNQAGQTVFAGTRWFAATLAPHQVPALQRLLEDARDYHECIYGESARPTAAEKFVSEIPPGRTALNKFVFGIWSVDGQQPRQLIGILDLVEGYPTEREWYLGTLILAPALHRQGIGKEILTHLEQWLIARGAGLIRLACAEQNEIGLKFWRNNGFSDERIFPPRMLGRRETTLIELTKNLSAGHN
jgi:ribosomal protein S18 acetylase RimI-like enzyme